MENQLKKPSLSKAAIKLHMMQKNKAFMKRFSGKTSTILATDMLIMELACQVENERYRPTPRPNPKKRRRRPRYNGDWKLDNCLAWGGTLLIAMGFLVLVIGAIYEQLI